MNPSKYNYKIKSEVLADKHKPYVDNYDCGNKQINNYLQNQALHDIDSVTHIYINESNNEIIAFVTLTCSAIDFCSSDGLYLSKRISAVEMKYFATDKKYQHRGYSSVDDTNKISDVILDDVYENTREFAFKNVGASKIILLSRPSAVSFYKRHGFKEFDDNVFFEPLNSRQNLKAMYADFYIEVYN